MNPTIPSRAPSTLKAAFDLTGRVAIITGGAGLLGVKHAEAVSELGAVPVLIDLDATRAQDAAQGLRERFGGQAVGYGVDITDEENISELCRQIVVDYGRIDILINNAANNPKVEAKEEKNFSRLENFPLDVWNQDISVGLTGVFICSRIFGAEMAQRGSGVILNIASDLALIAPDQRLYKIDGVAADQQSVKPVTYSVVKAGLVGLTLYLATYWADKGVRANTLAPGGVYAGQDDSFLERLNNLIPMGRMADKDEYKGAVAFMVSDASSYMNGATISVDGGRTAW